MAVFFSAVRLYLFYFDAAIEGQRTELNLLCHMFGSEPDLKKDIQNLGASSP